jgi:uncharacterized coiled-coil protein SlyX
MIIISGLNKEKKTTEKNEEEIHNELAKEEHIIDRLEQKIDTLTDKIEELEERVEEKE